MEMLRKLFEDLKYSVECQSEYEEFGVIDFYKDIEPFRDDMAPAILARMAVFDVQLGYLLLEQTPSKGINGFVYAIQYDVTPDIDEPFIIPHIVFSKNGVQAFVPKKSEPICYDVFQKEFLNCSWPIEIKDGKIYRYIFDDGVIRYIILPLLNQL